MIIEYNIVDNYQIMTNGEDEIIKDLQSINIIICKITQQSQTMTKCIRTSLWAL